MKRKINNLTVFIPEERKNISIIFVHGFPFDHNMWDAQVKEFSKDYYCVTYDIRGLGESYVGEGQFTMEMFVDDLDKIVDKLKIVRPVLCGLSMGGYISLRAMERIQDKFSALILCDTKSVADDNQTKLRRADGIAKIDSGALEIFIEEFVKNCFSEKFIVEHKSEFEKVVNSSKQNDPKGVKGCLIAMLSRTDTTESLQKIKIPTLVICGSDDKISPPELMNEMADRIPNSEFFIVEGAGHMAPVEKAERVNSHIRTFLEKTL